MKNLFKQAHKMTKEIVGKYEVNYQAQFTLCLNYLLENKGEVEMDDRAVREDHLINVIGVTEKQAKYALDIREAVLQGVDELIAKVETIEANPGSEKGKIDTINNILEAKELIINRKNEWRFMQNKNILHAEDKAKAVLELIAKGGINKDNEYDYTLGVKPMLVNIDKFYYRFFK